MPPRKRASAATSSAKPAPKPRASALAKQHNISASTELQIREAFTLFSQSSPSAPHGILPSASFRRALTALGVPPSSTSEARELLETVDPDDSGEITYEHFVAIAALKLQSQDDDAREEEVHEAFRLFIGAPKGREGGSEREQRITLGTLKRVARELKLEGELKEEILKDMILEANGGAGVERGVKVGEFEEVMRRAGALR